MEKIITNIIIAQNEQNDYDARPTSEYSEMAESSFVLLKKQKYTGPYEVISFVDKGCSRLK